MTDKKKDEDILEKVGQKVAALQTPSTFTPIADVSKSSVGKLAPEVLEAMNKKGAGGGDDESESLMISTKSDFDILKLPKDLLRDLSKLEGYFLKTKTTIQQNKLELAVLLKQLKKDKNYKKFEFKNFAQVCSHFGISEATGKRLINSIGVLRLDVYNAFMEIGISSKVLYNLKEGDIEIQGSKIRIGGREVELNIDNKETIESMISSLVKEREEAGKQIIEQQGKIEALTTEKQEIQEQLLQTSMDLHEALNQANSQCSSIQNDIIRQLESLKKLAKKTKDQEILSIIQATFSTIDNYFMKTKRNVFEPSDTESVEDIKFGTPEDMLAPENVIEETGDDDDDDDNE